MNTIGVQLPVPSGSATGAPAATSTFDRRKSIIVSGAFTGSVTVEFRVGQIWCPVATFTGPRKHQVDLVASEMRAVSRSVKGAPVVEIVAESAVSQFVTLQAGDPPTDLTSLGAFMTIVAQTGGGAAALEVSEDGINFVQASKTFTRQGDCQSKICPANFGRVRSTGTFGAIEIGAQSRSNAPEDTDSLVAVETGDTPNFLRDKLVSGSDITLTAIGPANARQIQIDSSDNLVGVEAGDTPDFLGNKLVAGSDVVLATVGPVGARQVQISASAGVAVPINYWIGGRETHADSIPLSVGAIQLDAAELTDFASFQFAVVASRGGPVDGEVILQNLTDAVPVVTLTFSNAAPTEQVAAIALAGNKLYEARIRLVGAPMGPTDAIQLYSANIVGVP